jgi:hypothetical protein
MRAEELKKQIREFEREQCTIAARFAIYQFCSVEEQLATQLVLLALIIACSIVLGRTGGTVFQRLFWHEEVSREVPLPLAWKEASGPRERENNLRSVTATF